MSNSPHVTQEKNAWAWPRRTEGRLVLAISTATLIVVLVILLRACTASDSFGLTENGQNLENGPFIVDCPPGEPGEPGATGQAGRPGQVGDTGGVGPAGVPGQTGPSGPQGSSGSSGGSGPTGPAGSTGSAGIPGPQGEQGPQGEPGAQGQQGVPGPAGETGTQGVQGLPGECSGGSGINVGDPCPIFHQQGDSVGVVQWVNEGKKSALECVAK
jgi:hypothetical protein